MPSWKMAGRAIGAAMIASTASCSDTLMAAVQERPEGKALGSQQEERATSAWPDNEPPGMTEILFVDGSSKDWPGFNQGRAWTDDARVAVVDDSESKYGKAIEKRFFVGDRSGWNGITHRADFGAYKELYFRMVFRFSANWQYHSGMNKMFYWGSTGRPTNRGPTQFFLGIRGGRFEFVNQADGRGDAHGSFRANAPRISRDEYHTVEVLHVANTPGRSDGSARMWIDGIEVEGFNQLGRRDRMDVRLENLRWVDYDDPRLTGIQAMMFWGGQRDTKRVNDWIRLSELYISGKNSVIGGSSEPMGQNLTGDWSFSATGGNSSSATTCDVEGTADLLQGGTKLDGNLVGTTTCSWPGGSDEWKFEDTVAGGVAGDNVVFDIIGSDGHANGTANSNSMTGTITWKIATGDPRGVVVLSGNWSGVRQ